jgi:predicted O-methyltransferase YrrM
MLEAQFISDRSSVSVLSMSLLSRLLLKLRFTTDKLFRLDSISRASHDAVAMQVLAPLSSTYQPWSTSALRPSGLVKILNEIVVNRRSCIVECGGGISTVYIAKLLKEQGQGHLYTIEDNLGWIDLLKGILQKQGVSDYVTVIPAPLTDCEFSLENNLWYDLSKFRSIVTPCTIDLLIVDGPPAYDQPRRLARYPALPALQDHLAPNFTVILDDINRSGEAEILVKWAAEFGLTFEKYFHDGDIAIARTQGGYHVG